MASSGAARELPPSRTILQMLTGKGIAQAVSVAATLGIADFLREEPKNVEAPGFYGNVMLRSNGSQRANVPSNSPKSNVHLSTGPSGVAGAVWKPNATYSPWLPKLPTLQGDLKG